MASNHQTITARVPKEIREQGDAALKRIDSTVTELVNSAFMYIIKTGELPSASPVGLGESPTKKSKRRFTVDQKAQFEAFLRATQAPLSANYAKLDAKQIKALRLAGKHGVQIMRVLIDTNVLIDYFGAREQFYNDAVKLKAASFFGDIELWATSNSFTDVFYILNKEYKSHIIQDMFLTSKEFLHICSVASSDVYDASNEKWSDFEDCLVHRCALKIKADALVARDNRGFTHAQIPCFTPAEFFDNFESKTGISYAEIA